MDGNELSRKGMRMIRIHLLAVISALSACSAFGQARDLQIVGTVQTEDGKVPSNVWVTAMLNPSPSGKAAAEFRPVNVHAQPDANGRFQLQGLTPGEYSVCAQIVSPEFINGCRWGITQNVTVPQASESFTLTIQKGQKVKIFLNDPKELKRQVKRKEDPLPFVEPDVQMELSANGAVYVNFTPVFAENQLSHYEALVPFDVPTRLHVKSKVFALREEDSKKLLNVEGETKPVTAARGGAEVVYRLALDSVRPESGK